MKLKEVKHLKGGTSCGGYSASGKPKAVCLHSTEGLGAYNVARYLQGRPDGSVHLVVDDANTYRLLTDSKVACGAAGYNDRVIHIEQCGFAGWKTKQWLRHLRTIRRAAYQTAVALKKHGLKPRRLKTAADHQRGGGYTYHNTVSKYYETDHTDPGPRYPYLKMDVLIKYYYRRVK